ncbi:hypothetical protein ACFXDJ_02380 [Streptomyces sp. NPDC059443]|uniref:hypothetical protein n=1 Tax=unclassified Streptomyces TaxID=2593676 RepID=UPI0036B61268
MTTPPGRRPGRRPARLRLSTLTSLLLMALIVVPSCGFLGWKYWQLEHPGDFTADPRPCELLSPQTVHRLTPTSYGGRLESGSCSWAAPRAEGPNRSGIFLRPSRVTESLAVKNLREERDDLLGWEETTPAVVTGVGDEAFIRFRTPDPARPATAQVCFRLSNLVVTLTYTRADSDREAARAGAVDAAREAAERLRASVR